MLLNNLNTSKSINWSVKTFNLGGKASPDNSENPLWNIEEQRLKRKAGNGSKKRKKY